MLAAEDSGDVPPVRRLGLGLGLGLGLANPNPNPKRNPNPRVALALTLTLTLTLTRRERAAAPLEAEAARLPNAMELAQLQIIQARLSNCWTSAPCPAPSLPPALPLTRTS